MRNRRGQAAQREIWPLHLGNVTRRNLYTHMYCSKHMEHCAVSKKYNKQHSHHGVSKNPLVYWRKDFTIHSDSTMYN